MLSIRAKGCVYMKRILLLGGSEQQIVAIRKAKELGYYTVLCDFLPDNPGQYVADKFHLVSTTDKEAILSVAIEEKIDGIVAYASDPAAPTAGYVGEKLGLPTNPYNSVRILGEKHLFREFLKNNQFNVPKSVYLEEWRDSIYNEIADFQFPIMVKPVDSSGSKGISKIDTVEKLKDAYGYACTFSRNKIIQIEEFITRDHDYLVGGDIFVMNGQVVFWGLLNCHRDLNVNPLVPVGKSFPLQLSQKRVDIIHSEVQRLMDSLNIKFGAFNVELIFDKNDRLYFIEMGPRNGGNMIPDLLSMISGRDMIEATVRCAMGDFSYDMVFDGAPVFYATHNLHSDRDGIYEDIRFDQDLDRFIIRKNLYKKSGDAVFYFDGANKALGIIFMKFDSFEQLCDYTSHINDHIEVLLK